MKKNKQLYPTKDNEIEPGTYTSQTTCLINYICYKKDENTITLDGDFTLDELQFFISIMEDGGKQNETY